MRSLAVDEITMYRQTGVGKEYKRGEMVVNLRYGTVRGYLYTPGGEILIFTFSVAPPSGLIILYHFYVWYNFNSHCKLRYLNEGQPTEELKNA
jgi:hypothetical protein